MNIPLQRDRIYVSWTLYYEDGGVIESWEEDWNDEAEFQLIDGINLSFTTRKVRKLTLFNSPYPFSLIPPEPLPFFAFTRLGRRLELDERTSITNWLYTAFGYILPDFALVVKITPDDHQLLLLPRPMTFPL